MEVKERSWKNILINPPFQLKFLSYFVGLFVLTTISLYSTTFLFFWNMKNKGLNVGIPEGHVYYTFLMNQKHDLDIVFIGLTILNFVLLILIGFIVSHRIAGPIHKVKQFLHDPISIEKVEMRENDFFKELGPIVSKLRDKLK